MVFHQKNKKYSTSTALILIDKIKIISSLIYLQQNISNLLYLIKVYNSQEDYVLGNPIPRK